MRRNVKVRLAAGLALIVSPFVLPTDAAVDLAGSVALGWAIGSWAFKPSRDRARIRQQEMEEELRELGGQADFQAGFVCGWNAGVEPSYLPQNTMELAMRARADWELHLAERAVALDRPDVSGA